MAAAMFLAKRGVINIYRASPREYNNGVRFVGRATTSRYFTSGRDDEMRESSSSSSSSSEEEESMSEAREAAMGTTTDGKAPNVSVSYASNTTKESGDTAAATAGGGEEGAEEDVAVGVSGTIRGENRSSG
ncbi:PREDICTED: uncharacterized protein LOC104799932 [Tarenaya hassleriana]|uniref:uncharacterized protein LOC104799932 n=1 Tax=Tarenaya hassleriana TaxID=28532 RepID=UPI00053C1C2C|nr:PREDICTED: uncharacterized protein LOC104799932 [Tarenaya hassleriana]